MSIIFIMESYMEYNAGTACFLRMNKKYLADVLLYVRDTESAGLVNTIVINCKFLMFTFLNLVPINYSLFESAVDWDEYN